MKKYISLLIAFAMIASFVNVIPDKPNVAHAVNVKDVPVFDTISTFYNETVTISYQASSDASFVIPVSIAALGDLSLDIDLTNFTEDYLVRIYSDDSYIGLIQTTLLPSSETSHKIDMTMGGNTTIYMMIRQMIPQAQTRPLTQVLMHPLTRLNQ